jgi:hypothetical protein
VICDIEVKLPDTRASNDRVICKVTLSSPCLWASFHPKTPLSVVSAGSHPVYDQAQGSGAVFSLTFQITLNICYCIHFSERNPSSFQIGTEKERLHVGWEHFLLTPQITNKTPQHHLIKWQLDLLLLLHHGPILEGHFHEADVKADACWGRPALRVYEEVRPPNNINSKNII